jgi:hypothetical protein
LEGKKQTNEIEKQLREEKKGHEWKQNTREEIKKEKENTIVAFYIYYYYYYYYYRQRSPWSDSGMTV